MLQLTLGPRGCRQSTLRDRGSTMSAAFLTSAGWGFSHTVSRVCWVWTGVASDSPRVALDTPHRSGPRRPDCTTTTVETRRQVSLRRIQSRKWPRRRCHRQWIPPPRSYRSGRRGQRRREMPATEPESALRSLPRGMDGTAPLTSSPSASGRLLAYSSHTCCFMRPSPQRPARLATIAAAGPHYPPVQGQEGRLGVTSQQQSHYASEHG